MVVTSFNYEDLFSFIIIIIIIIIFIIMRKQCFRFCILLTNFIGIDCFFYLSLVHVDPTRSTCQRDSLLIEKVS